MKTKILTALLLIALSSCSNNNTDTKAEEEKIRYNLEHWQKIGATGDIDKIMTYWSDDAILMIPGLPTINGKDAIRKMIERSKGSAPKMTWDSPSSITLSKSGDLAYVITKNHITMTDSTGNSLTQDNKALLIWKKQDDNSWKEAIVIFNGDPSSK
jgi:uncharacterized protein (TIGR02246 family)